MTKILEVIIALLIIWIVYCAVALLVSRLRLYFRINSLVRSMGAKVSYLKLPMLSLFKLSKAPELSVSVGNTVYLIRIFNGGGIGKIVHFASEEYAVRFSRMRISAYVKRRTHEKLVTARSGFAVGTKVIRVPLLDASRVDIPQGKIVKKVLIFNPAPGEVSYVTEEKTSIKVAFTGDDVLGTLIFTGSTFVTYAERAYRTEKILAESKSEGESSK